MYFLHSPMENGNCIQFPTLIYICYGLYTYGYVSFIDQEQTSSSVWYDSGPLVDSRRLCPSAGPCDKSPGQRRSLQMRNLSVVIRRAVSQSSQGSLSFPARGLSWSDLHPLESSYLNWTPLCRTNSRLPSIVHQLEEAQKTSSSFKSLKPENWFLSMHTQHIRHIPKVYISYTSVCCYEWTCFGGMNKYI